MINTHEELLQKIKDYESKWGKLGHTNIIHPEKNTIYHSGTNKDISQGGNKTMSRMDNDLYKFRQKVAAGKEANKLAHKSYISPEELNKMNYEQLMKSRTLVHAQNPLYGQQNPNAKYYKREGEPGKYRYYYTKEEWDAAHKQGSASTEANREAQERQQYETNKKIENYTNKQNVTNTSSNTRENNLQADFTKKFSDIARQSPEAAAKEIVNDENTKIKTLYNKVNDGFRKGIITWKNGRFEKDENASDSDYENIKNEIEAYSDQLENFIKGVDAAAGSGRKTKDAVAKIMADEIESMYQKAEKGKENLKANQNAREEAIKKSQKAEQDRQIDEIKKENKKLYDDANDLAAEKMSVNNKSAIDDIKMAISKSSGRKIHEINKIVDEKVSEYYPEEERKKDEAARMALIEERNTLYDEINKNGGTNDYKNIDKTRKELELGRKIRDMERNEYEKEIKATLDALEDLMNDPDYGKNAAKWLEFDGLLYGITRDLNEYGKKTHVNKQIQEFIDKYYKGAKKENNSAKHSTSGKALITNSSMGEEIMDEYAIFQQKVKRGKEMNRIAHSTFISPEELNAKYEKDLESQGILVHGGNYKYYNKIDLPNGTTRYFYTKAEWDAYQDGKGQDAKKKQEETIRKNKEASQHEGDRYIDKEKERKKMYQDLADQARKHNEEIAQKEKNEKQNAFNRERGAELGRIKKYANAINNGDPSYPMRDVYYAIMDDHEKEIKQFESDVTFGSRNEKYEPSYDPYEDFTLDEMSNVGVLNPDKKPKYEYDETGKAILPEIKFNDKALEKEYNDLLNKLLDDAKKAKKAAGYTKDDENLENMIKYYLDRELFDSWLDWYHPQTGTDRYWDLKQEEINDVIEKQNKNAVTVETETYANGKKVNSKKE